MEPKINSSVLTSDSNKHGELKWLLKQQIIQNQIH